MDTKQLLGKRLKELIKQKCISQEKLAEMVEIEPTALSNIVTGRNYPLFTTLEKILKVLDVSFADVFKFEHHQENEVLIEQIVELLKNNPDRMKDFYKIAKALVD
jgi:transcriptional regulator with XRE-family HTH domain